MKDQRAIDAGESTRARASQVPSAVVIGLALLFAALPAAHEAEAQDNTRRANDVIDAISGSIGVLELSGLPEALEVEADHFEYDYQTGALRCSGNVTVKQGEVRLYAGELRVVSITAGKLTFRRITALGRVKVSKGKETATGDRAVYDQGSATITLTGDARLSSGNKTVSGEKVVFNLDEGRAEVRSTQGPVRAVIDTGVGSGDPPLDELDDFGDGNR